MKNSTVKDIVYGKTFYYWQRGKKLLRFFKFKLCFLPGCENQVKAFLYKSQGKSCLCSIERFKKKQYCSKSCAAQANWRKKRLAKKNYYKAKKNITPVDDVQRFLSPGIKNGFNYYMRKLK